MSSRRTIRRWRSSTPRNPMSLRRRRGTRRAGGAAPRLGSGAGRTGLLRGLALGGGGRRRVGPRSAGTARRRPARAARTLRGGPAGPGLGGRGLATADHAHRRLHLVAHGRVVRALDRPGLDDVKVHRALVDLDQFDLGRRPREKVRRAIAGQPCPDQSADYQEGRRDLDRRPGIAAHLGDLDRGETGLVHFWEHGRTPPSFVRRDPIGPANKAGRDRALIQLEWNS